MGTDFPMQFGGCEYSMIFSNGRQLKAAVDTLFNCGHMHNIAVAIDGSILFGSSMAIACLEANIDAISNAKLNNV